MEVFVAKQPIVNEREEVIAYELLYRGSLKNTYPGIDGDQATAEVIINSFLNIGIEKLTNGKPCFINFTEKLLQLRLPTYFGTREIVVEILESGNGNKDIHQVCQELKELGYQIALDDVGLNMEYPLTCELFEYADFIKVDFLSRTKEEREKIEKAAKQFNKKLVAEKIETLDAFEEAKSSGYDFFQGFLFAKPSIVTTRDIPTYFFSDYEFLGTLMMEEADIDMIIGFIERDLSLSYKLLKLINSHPFHRTEQRVHSVKQAVLMLGLIEIKKWLYILSVREETSRQEQAFSKDLLRSSLTRAKMCEYIVKLRKNSDPPSAYFTLGLFSLVDELMGIPMEEVIEDLPLHEDQLDALVGTPNHLKDVLDLVCAVERAEWLTISEKCCELRIDEKDVFKVYAESINWANQYIKKDEKLLI